MIEARVEHNTKEFLLGHKVSRGLDNEYDRTPVHNRLSEYLKAIELLTISPENILRKKLAESEMTINTKLAQKDKQISALERQMRQYRKEVQMLMSNPKQVQKMLAEISNKMNG
jgi:predicted ribosome quality control (RQC) complex YloA/Tae2 family protein